MTNGNTDGLSNAPWYVAFFIRVGLPTAFASALLWFLMTNVTASLSDLGDGQIQANANQALVITTQAKIIDLLSTHAATEMTSAYLLQAMCYNTAQTDIERGRCTDAFRASSGSR